MEVRTRLHTANLWAEEDQEERLCSCPKTKICPLDGKCLSKNVIYEATVTQQNNKTNRYTGICSTDFKARLAAHKHTIKDGSQNQTSYSKFVRNLEQKKIKHTVTWRILARGGIYSPMTEKCSLCIKEKFFIMFRPESADINSKDEIFSSCRHKKMKLLIPKERKKRNKGPGWLVWKWKLGLSWRLTFMSCIIVSYLFTPEERTPVLETWSSKNKWLSNLTFIYYLII